MKVEAAKELLEFSQMRVDLNSIGFEISAEDTGLTRLGLPCVQFKIGSISEQKTLFITESLEELKRAADLVIAVSNIERSSTKIPARNLT